MTPATLTDRFPHTSILASAGSGKTYQLTSRYLALVDAGAPVGSILTSTFTRLAAGEIQDRILLRLAEAAHDEGKRSEIAAALGRDALGAAEVTALLRTLCRDLHRMQVRTLDSFFGSVVRSFALELGIPPGSSVVEGARAEQLRAEAIASMLAAGDAGQLLTLLRLLTQGTSERSVLGVIDRTVRDLYALYRETEDAAWDPLPARPVRSPADLETSLRRLEAAVPTLDKRHAAAHGRDCARARDADWEGFLANGLVVKITAEDGRFYGKEIEPDVVEAYVPVIEHATGVLVNRLRDQTLATRRLLEAYRAHYEAACRSAGVMTFADVTAAMSDAERLGTFGAMCYRIDAVVRHLLLDEFQDTNVQQWRSIEPIARELVSDETQPRTFFCVGDVKQSIYGWRDACPEVLDDIPRLLVRPDGTSAIEERTLSRSWRSSMDVLDVVNTVFEGLEGNAALDKKREYGDAAALFMRGFRRHDTAKKELDGYVELRTVPRPQEHEKQSDVRLRAAAELVRDVHARAPERSIGVLTRTNAGVARIRWELGPGRLGLETAGRGGTPLSDSPAVNAVLDLLRLADHPGDTVAAFHVARGPLGAVMGLTDETSAGQRRRVARSVRRDLLEHGYAHTCAGWVRRLAPSCDERDYRRLLQLVELGAAYDESATLRPGDFVAIVEDESISESSPAQVQVMTVHQSKGLEFDVVVLPELEKHLVGTGSPPVVFEREGGTGPVTRVFRWVNEHLRPLIPEIEPMIEHHLVRTARESLCVLYVAMTRAKQGLFMLIDPPKIKKGGVPSDNIAASSAGILRCALHGIDPPEADEVLYAHGRPASLETAARDGDEDGPPPAAPVGPITLARPAPGSEGGGGRGAAAAPPSALAGAHSPLADRLRLRDDEPLDRGRAVHRLFEEITWLDDWTADDDALLALVREIAPRRGDSWAREIVGLFRRAIEHSEIRERLSRGTIDPGAVRVRRERRFVALSDDDRVREGSIDRLVAHLDAEGRPVRATVIDFKTDRVEAEDAAAGAEGYRGQLESYRAAAARMLRLEESAIDMVLLFVQPGVAVEL